MFLINLVLMVIFCMEEVNSVILLWLIVVSNNIFVLIKSKLFKWLLVMYILFNLVEIFMIKLLLYLIFILKKCIRLIKNLN